MEERSRHLTVVIGASAIAEELRRSLVSHGVVHAGVATHLRGLRKLMLLGDSDLVVICIAMDQNTLNRHGEHLRMLLVDHHCFPRTVRSVGLLNEIGLTSDMAELGCDLFVHDSSQALEAIDLLARRWEVSRAEQRLQSNRLLQSGDIEQQSWLYGIEELPSELAPLVADEQRGHEGFGSSNS